KGAWIVSTHPARLFSRNQAITALSLAERLAAGYGDDDPFVQSWRAGGVLFPPRLSRPRPRPPSCWSPSAPPGASPSTPHSSCRPPPPRRHPLPPPPPSLSGSRP